MSSRDPHAGTPLSEAALAATAGRALRRDARRAARQRREDQAADGVLREVLTLLDETEGTR